MNLHVCVPNYRGWIEAPHHQSMVQLFHMLGTQQRAVQLTDPSHTVVSVARQICVNAALQDREMTHLVFIDDDMVFTPHQFAALEREFLTHDLDFLAALAFTNAYPTKPCVFGKNPDFDEDGAVQWWYVVSDYPERQRFEVYASGFGMCLISRRLLEGMRDRLDSEQFFVYQHPLCPNEDVAFCLNARKCGFKLHADSRVAIGHISKDRPIITEEIYKAQGNAIEYHEGITRRRFVEPHEIHDLAAS